MQPAKKGSPATIMKEGVAPATPRQPTRSNSMGLVNMSVPGVRAGRRSGGLAAGGRREGGSTRSRVGSGRRSLPSQSGRRARRWPPTRDHSRPHGRVAQVGGVGCGRRGQSVQVVFPGNLQQVGGDALGGKWGEQGVLWTAREGAGLGATQWRQRGRQRSGRGRRRGRRLAGGGAGGRAGWRCLTCARAITARQRIWGERLRKANASPRLIAPVPLPPRPLPFRLLAGRGAAAAAAVGAVAGAAAGSLVLASPALRAAAASISMAPLLPGIAACAAAPLLLLLLLLLLAGRCCRSQ